VSKFIEVVKIMANVNIQSNMKELQKLKKEENVLMTLATKVSDQLNRLKVEELALQNMVRLQNEELERKSRGSQRSINRSLPMDESDKGDDSKDDDDDIVVPVDLVVNRYLNVNQVEEEEDDEDEEVREITNADIDAFVDGLS